MSERTLIHPDDVVVYEVAICDHPLIVGEDDDRTDAELIADVEARTETRDGLTMPEWTVFVSDPPDDETLRYVDTTTRINVRMPYEESDVFEEIASRLTIEGFDDFDMSHWGATHEDDFDGDVHLDFVGDDHE